jgi:hypothetical protein
MMDRGSSSLVKSHHSHTSWIAVVYLVLVIVVDQVPCTWAFLPPTLVSSKTIRVQTLYHQESARYGSSSNDPDSKKPNEKSNNNNDNNNNIDALTQTSWYAVEWFGKLFGRSSSSTTTNSMTTFSGPPSSIQETLQRIQLDNDRAYFLSGEVDQELYAPNCVFSDPFVSFEGRDRFVTNLANLGSFITKYDAKVLKYDQPDAVTIETKVSPVFQACHFRFLGV